MSQQPPCHRKKPKFPTSYAAVVTCLRCDRRFYSWDRRQNRLCDGCRAAVEHEPSPEPEYDLPKRRGPLRNGDEG
jgi:hypothetical protein